MDAPQSFEDLRTRPFFSKFSSGELEAAFALLEPRAVRAYASIPLNQEFTNRIGFAWCGKLSVGAISPNGRMITLFSLAPGEPFGYAAPFHGGGFGPPVRLVSDSPALVLHADARAFIDFAIHTPAAAAAFFGASARRLMDYSTRLYELATLDSKTRLCCELLRLSARGEWVNQTCRLTPSRAAIAMHISVAREAVSRGLKELSAEGLLSVEGYTIILHDLPALREIVRLRSGNLFVPYLVAEK